MIFPSFFVALLIAALAAAQDSNTTTYNVTISWYGTNDPKGSPNCNSNTVACGFYTYPGYAAAVSQNLFGAGPGEGKGPACGTCYRLTIETDAQSGSAVPNAGSSIVVKVNNLCPADAQDPICAQPDLQTPNQYGGVVDFNLCNDDGAHAALLAPAATGLARGTAVMVGCGEWNGTEKTDCGSLCGQSGKDGQGLGGGVREEVGWWGLLLPLGMMLGI
ncbi:hypothetical protein SLS64_009726 [Diaporthe eres]|uniref:Expansin-like EG45 domain-containing protein n=1 Tax=Diaporthe eres TaxID=83184 RepID=A0ABR1P3Y1_DIAER